MSVSPNADALLILLGSTASSLRRARLRAAFGGLLVAAGTCVLVARLAALAGLPPDALDAAQWLAAILIAVTAAGAFAWAGRPVPRDEAARRLDRHHALRDALSSAAAFLDRPAPEPLERLHITRAAGVAARLTVPRVAVPDRAWMMAAAVLWGALGLWHVLSSATVSPAPDLVLAQERQTRSGDATRASLPAGSGQQARADSASTEIVDSVHRPAMPGPSAPGDAPVSPRSWDAGAPNRDGGPAASTLPAAAPGANGGAPSGPSGSDAVAAREDLARALSALFDDTADRPDDTVSQNGVGLPPSKRPRRVESPRGGSEAGRTHLAVDDRPGALQGEVARIRQDGARGGSLPLPPSHGRWLPSGATPDDARRAMPAPASLGAEGGAAAPAGRESLGEEEGAFDPVDGPLPTVVAVKPTAETAPPGRPGRRGERRGDPVPTTFERAAVPLRVITAPGPPGRESARDAVRTEPALTPALREYALYVNRSQAR